MTENTHLQKVTREVISEMLKDPVSVMVLCETCGQIFLQKSYADFQTSSNVFIREPDDWLLETGVHYCDFPDHNITQRILGFESSLTERWRLKTIRELMSLTYMKAQLLKKLGRMR